jgi:hypothetical protein
MKAVVPKGATSGSISVITPRAVLQSRKDFVVKQ